MRSALEASVLLAFCLVFEQKKLDARVDNTPPVPYLNEDGSVPANQQKHRVFLDRNTGDAYIRFDPKEQKLTPVELSTHIDPSISVRISYEHKTHTWLYEYELKNGIEAKQNAGFWFIKDLYNDSCSVSVPKPWIYSFPALITSPPWPRLALYGSFQNVAPGHTATGIKLSSSLGPGLSMVAVAGNAKILQLPGEPDNETVQELKLVTGFPYNFKFVYSLFPLIAVKQETAAAVYLQQLKHCISLGLCSPSFVDVASKAISNSNATAAIEAQKLDRMSETARLPLDRRFTSVFEVIFGSSENTK